MAWNGSDNKVKIEGQGQQKRANVRSSTSPLNCKALCAGLIAVVIGCAGVWWFFGRGGVYLIGNGHGVKRTAKIAEVAPAVITDHEAKVEAKNSKEKTALQPLKANATNNVALPTDEASILARIDAEYKKRGVRRIFRYNTDTFLSQYVIPGQVSPPPPWDKNSKDEFVKSILDPIVITDEDNEHERELKEGVKVLRSELVKWIKDGGTFEEYVENLQKRQDREAMIMTETKKFVNEAVKNSDNTDEAVELWRAANKRLEEQGLRKMKLPVHLRLALKRQHLAIPEE